MQSSTIRISPNQIYFTHSRIRGTFTGCSKLIEHTYKEIQDNIISITDLPLITVIENEGYYFSLNNRRLYLIKKLLAAGILSNDNLVQVRLKKAVEREKERYTIARCALNATIMGVNDKGDDEDESIVTLTNSEGKEVISSSIAVTTKESNTCRYNSLSQLVKKSMKGLVKLMDRGKVKEVLRELDQWTKDGVITAQERVFIASEIGLGV